MKASKEPLNDTGFAPQVSQNPASTHVDPEESELVRACSALMDEPISDQEWDALWESSLRRSSTLEDWNAYQIVGDALRGNAPLVAVTPPSAFLANFQARMDLESSAVLGTPVGDTQGVLASPSLADGRRVPAANDAIFRWKMLAMVASVSAVMAVSWGVLGTVGGDGALQTAPELAQVAPTAHSSVVAVAEPDSVNSSIVVNTGQGPLLRDARLEALLAEHRQYGGLSALQKPAGFLRNATYDTPDR